jgi:hypothetical protein
MANEAIIVLGDEDEQREYTVGLPAYGVTRAWRGRFDQEVTPILGALLDLRGFDFDKIRELKSIPELLAVISSVAPTLIKSVDKLYDLLMLWSPELRADQEWIELHAHDPQIVEAFLQVARMAYPLETLTSMFGRPSPGTSKNSPVQRGRSATRKLVPTESSNSTS